MFNISEFKSRINRYGGPARTSLFEVNISPFNIRGQTIVNGVMNVNDLTFFCQTVTMPGINLETASYREGGIGFTEFMPMNAAPDQLNCVFMLDSNHRVMTFFHRWISSVVNVSGNRGTTSSGLGNKLIDYKENYAATELTIKHYSTHNQNQFYECRYLSVYPTQVSSIDLNWAANDSPATMTVNFSYNKLIYQGFRDLSFEASGSFVGAQSSIPRGNTIAEFVRGFDQTTLNQNTLLL